MDISESKQGPGHAAQFHHRQGSAAGDMDPAGIDEHGIGRAPAFDADDLLGRKGIDGLQALMQGVHFLRRGFASEECLAGAFQRKGRPDRSPQQGVFRKEGTLSKNVRSKTRSGAAVHRGLPGGRYGFRACANRLFHAALRVRARLTPSVHRVNRQATGFLDIPLKAVVVLVLSIDDPTFGIGHLRAQLSQQIPIR
jgi:hypothetical protein